MPVYAYKCKNCTHQFDIRQSFSDEPLTQCPVCDGEVRKQFNTVGVVFKGSGFYRTDSRAGGSETRSTTSSNAGTGASTSGSASGSSTTGSSTTSSASSAASH